MAVRCPPVRFDVDNEQRRARGKHYSFGLTHPTHPSSNKNSSAREAEGKETTHRVNPLSYTL